VTQSGSDTPLRGRANFSSSVLRQVLSAKCFRPVKCASSNAFRQVFSVKCFPFEDLVTFHSSAILVTLGDGGLSDRKVIFFIPRFLTDFPLPCLSRLLWMFRATIKVRSHLMTDGSPNAFGLRRLPLPKFRSTFSWILGSDPHPHNP
jgi:hypothetical protein